MAKLGSYYGLCPLIDQRNLLGVSDDVETGHVVVTLGKNIAIKYRLSDQKQIHSWRTKDKFSSPVIYDVETNQYVAVFNQVYVRVWKGDEEYVDKLKKYKFNYQIHTLVRAGGKAFVVFKNGDVVALHSAIENRKNLELDNGNLEHIDITDVLHSTFQNKICIAIISKGKSNISFHWNIFNEENTKVLGKIELNRKYLVLAGQVLTPTENLRSLQLLTLWSDGKLYSYLIDTESTSNQLHLGEQLGSVYAVVESLSCKTPVTMVSLNNHYIAMYGADPNQEGATLILYNTQFKVSQSRQPLKLFTSGAKLWHTENNVVLCVGQNLAVIPFYLDIEQLAALIGSHRNVANDPDITVVEELEVVSWSSNVEPELTNNKLIPKKILRSVLDLSNQGFSESTICEQLVPDFIDKNDVDAISSCLEYFCDIPEYCIVKLLCFCLTANSNLFKKMQHIESAILPEKLQPLERCRILDKILMCSFSDVLILPKLRSQLNLNCSLLLLQYICYLMSEEGHSLQKSSISESENKLIEWVCLLLDANYQKFLLSKDPNILEVLSVCRGLTESYLKSLENLRQIVPILTELKKGKELVKHKQITNLKYSVEQLSLY